MKNTFRVSLEESKQKVEPYMAEGYHCGPSILQIMHEALGSEDESMLWAGINMFGGMTRHREGVCGAVTGLPACDRSLLLLFPWDEFAAEPDDLADDTEIAQVDLVRGKLRPVVTHDADPVARHGLYPLDDDGFSV